MIYQTIDAATAIARNKRGVRGAAAVADGWRLLCLSGGALLSLSLMTAIVPTLLAGSLLIWSVTSLRQAARV